MSHDLNETLIFVKVVEQGSFIAAAKALGLPKTTVSRKVQELE
ncbi:TPA: LysR family transcriptional regulator, partial [Stenotrophomonas maltophilia]|nr:LysR family transcriptional regulator [Stenotrophomonas maltophilia]HDS1221339.1 LysR family transcriptional regulator [Stenotrophomonas maltophilia]